MVLSRWWYVVPRVRTACQLTSVGNGRCLLPPETVGPTSVEVMGVSVGVGRSSLPLCKTPYSLKWLARHLLQFS